MSQTAMSMPGTVQSVVQSRRNGPLLAAAAALWVNEDDQVLDMTYGRGNFWTDYRPSQLVTNDINPASDADYNEDFRSLPFSSGSFDVIVFDPPYIAQGGRDTSTVADFMDRYGLMDVAKTTVELATQVADGIGEATRLLAPKGRLMVKCMDYINGGRYVQGRHWVVMTAETCGLRQVDELVHYSGTGPQPDRARQIHSRRAHSFLCIFQKKARAA